MSEMIIYVPRQEEYPALVELWEASVRASHRFLTEADIAAIRPFVPAAFAEVRLFCLGTGCGEAAGFIGAAGKKLEMLFTHPRVFGTGVGKRLLRYAIDELRITEVDVNEQNDHALSFYRHFGFEVMGRSELDSAGRPFPILHLGLKK